MIGATKGLRAKSSCRLYRTCRHVRVIIGLLRCIRAAIGTNPTFRGGLTMSVHRGRPEDICSDRVLPMLTASTWRTHDEACFWQLGTSQTSSSACIQSINRDLECHAARTIPHRRREANDCRDHDGCAHASVASPQMKGSVADKGTPATCLSRPRSHLCGEPTQMRRKSPIQGLSRFSILPNV